jgi:hypothetical protein
MTPDAPTPAPTHRCQHRTVIARCTAPATHRFLVNGIPATYAGYTCLAHGEQVCAEYAIASATIGAWTLEALDAAQPAPEVQP